MAGGIYSDQRCPLCGGVYRDDGRRGLSCPAHPQQRATAFILLCFFPIPWVQVPSLTPIIYQLIQTDSCFGKSLKTGSGSGQVCK